MATNSAIQNTKIIPEIIKSVSDFGGYIANLNESVDIVKSDLEKTNDGVSNVKSELDKTVENINTMAKKDGTLQSNLNSEKLNGKTATSTPATTEKNDIIGMVNEVFQSGVDAKSKVVTAVNAKGGSVTTNSTWDQVSTAIKNIKSGYGSGDIIRGDKAQVTLEKIWEFTGHSGSVNTLEMAWDGGIYTGSADKTVRYIDSDGNEKWKYTGHTGAIRVLTASSNGGSIYTGGDDGTIRKLDHMGKEQWKFTGHSGSVRSLLADRNGWYLYSGGTDGTLRKISISNGTEVWRRSLGGTVNAIVFNGMRNFSADVMTVSTSRQRYDFYDEDGNEVGGSGGSDDIGVINALTHSSIDEKITYMAGSKGRISRESADGGSSTWYTEHSGSINMIIATDTGVYTGGADKKVIKTDHGGGEIWTFDNAYTINALAAHSGASAKRFVAIASGSTVKLMVESYKIL